MHSPVCVLRDTAGKSGGGIPLRPQRFVDQLAALTNANLKDDAGKVKVGVISDAISKVHCSVVEMTHEVHQAYAITKRTNPVSTQAVCMCKQGRPTGITSCAGLISVVQAFEA